MNPLLNKLLQAVVLAAITALAASMQDHFDQQDKQR